MATPEDYMRRCFALARLGAGQVSPNPMVGALLVYKGRILGEGWHQRYGEAHAEVNAIANVAPLEHHLLRQATLYCSLEPCAHYGKTPPCVDLILREGIPEVVIANTDPNPLVAGKSIARLRAAGVRVHTGVLEAEGRYLNRAFFTCIRQRRPHIVLKWAQTADGLLGRAGERTPITGPLAQRLTHRWRAEADAILVGTRTALVDNPHLGNRLYFGPSPLRIALDFDGKLPLSARLLDDRTPTWILGPERPGQWRNTHFWPIPPREENGRRWWVSFLLEKLREAEKGILLVEGGADVLGQFIELDCWDEIRLLQSPHHLHAGVEAPRIPVGALLRETYRLGDDVVQVWTHPQAG
ncbi:MAG: bifunctional diaminohydroxyphosphoribosylaminopyrimidine deaminase/5-amino-6-(5-phosphoribosylamino)uracil reductase RibD [Saprospiraceae bacterium]|nr:bifunctional diaminohydroxyphosphoribosylaminopyrimidine deaminase/5-amino-6-(5-phosphoribosylamino)uracil reductase RibD [Saprospiraceae bacterium]MDW8228652.1 bifunctional diaminohydroxyphosphoribosylaminopyrimidine deaminase/5-amino-6-(5-phosphoribosylamino)uracil reductase RibD [Saprospiraceae bacterium]